MGNGKSQIRLADLVGTLVDKESADILEELAPQMTAGQVRAYLGEGLSEEETADLVDYRNAVYTAVLATLACVRAGALAEHTAMHLEDVHEALTFGMEEDAAFEVVNHFAEFVAFLWSLGD